MSASLWLPHAVCARPKNAAMGCHLLTARNGVRIRDVRKRNIVQPWLRALGLSSRTTPEVAHSTCFAIRHAAFGAEWRIHTKRNPNTFNTRGRRVLLVRPGVSGAMTTRSPGYE